MQQCEKSKKQGNQQIGIAANGGSRMNDELNDSTPAYFPPSLRAEVHFTRQLPGLVR